MKIKVTKKSYADVMSLTPAKHKKPLKPNIFWRTVMKIAAIPDLLKTGFKCKKVGMEKLGKREPCFVLMNHSSFIDLSIAASIMYPRPFNIVATNDSFMGKAWLMRQIGCIPTKKFVADLTLIKDITHAIKKNNCSVLMYPEAGYSLDGRKTVLPDSVGKFAKKLGVPVITIITDGAFLRDPLYNNLQNRRVKVSATMKYLLSPDDLASMTDDEINAAINREFDFDNFKIQQENRIKVDEPFRADLLNRVLYKCPHCMSESSMKGEGIKLTCTDCGKEYVLDEYGYIAATDGDSKFTHIPDWYDWERACVKQEIEAGEYSLELPVEIYMSIDVKKMYYVGEGTLTHNAEGIRVQGCSGELDYLHTPRQSYTVSSEYYFYEIGDIVSVGNHKALYYCMPKTDRDVVTKIRLAAEELYKLSMATERTTKR